jgi:hypothetical protein
MGAVISILVAILVGLGIFIWLDVRKFDRELNKLITIYQWRVKHFNLSAKRWRKNQRKVLRKR